MDVGKNIKEIRLQKGISQDLIGEAIGRNSSAISRIENDGRAIKVTELAEIANALGVHITYLLTYPKRFVDVETVDFSEKVSVVFEVPSDKKEELLKMVRLGKEYQSNEPAHLMAAEDEKKYKSKH